MTASTKSRRAGARSDPRTPDAEEMVEVNLRRSVAQSRGGPFYGPGVTKVPKSLAESLKLSPDLVETDVQGNPLPHTIAASVFGGGVSTETVRDAHPTVKRDPETGDMIEDDDDAPVSEVARRAAAIAENAEQGPDRQGGQLASESGSLENIERGLQSVPGQTEPSASQRASLEADAVRDRAAEDRTSSGGASSVARGSAAAGGGSAGGGGRKGGAKGGSSKGGGAESKPMTKSQLREQDQEVLLDLARRNRVKVPNKATKKQIVDKLYNAQVTLD